MEIHHIKTTSTHVKAIENLFEAKQFEIVINKALELLEKDANNRPRCPLLPFTFLHSSTLF